MHAFIRRRRAFTLVELLVVMTLIAVLAALMIGFFPNALSSAREARSAQTIQGLLNAAKQRALRDQSPRGVRFWVINANNALTAFNSLPNWNAGTGYQPLDSVIYNNLAYRCAQPNTNIAPTGSPMSANYWYLWSVCIECQYLEQPEDFAGGPSIKITSNAAGNVINVNFANNTGDLVNGYLPQNIAERKYWQVWPATTTPPVDGDFLEVMGTGLMHQITNVVVTPINATQTSNQISITPNLPNPITTATPNFRIVRGPRPVGDETIKLSSDTCIDFSTNIINWPVAPIPYVLDTTTGSGYVDIMFGPSGAVVSRGVAAPNLHLFVRVPDAAQPTNLTRGEPTIISTFVRTGFVGSFNVDPNGLTPYTFVK